MAKNFFAVLAILIIAGIGVWNWQKGDKTLNQVQGDKAIVQEDKDRVEKPVVKIGVVLPLNGNSAFAGVAVQKSVKLALDDIKKKQKLKYDYELIFDDSQNQQKQSLLNVNRLYGLNRVNALLTMWAPAGIVASSFAEKNKLPHIGCSWGYDVAKGIYNFNHATLPDEQSDFLIKQLLKRKIKRIGFIWDAEKSQQELIELIKTKLAENNIEIVFDTMVTRGTLDFRTDILKMQDTNPDILFVLMMPPGLNRLVQQLKELNWNVPMTSIEYFSFAPELFEGQWYISDALGDQDFIKYIEEQTGEKINSCMANLYDGLHFIMEGFEKAPLQKGEILPNGEKVVKSMLNNHDFKSVMGKIRIDEEGNIHTQPTVKIIRNGKTVVIEE